MQNERDVMDLDLMREALEYHLDNEEVCDVLQTYYNKKHESLRVKPKILPVELQLYRALEEAHDYELALELIVDSNNKEQMISIAKEVLSLIEKRGDVTCIDQL